MLNNGKLVRIVALGGVLTLLLGIIGACAGDGGTVPQQPQQPAAASQPVAAAAAADPEAPAPATGGALTAGAVGVGSLAKPISKGQSVQNRAFRDDGIPQYGGQLRTYVSTQMPNLNQFDRAVSSTAYALMPVHDTLVRWDPNTDLHTYRSIAPGVAKSWEMSEDGTVITFTLRDDVLWHDGVPFSSADVKATYDNYLDPGDRNPQGRQYIEPYVTAVEAPDAHTVVIRLKGATPPDVVLKNWASNRIVLMSAKYVDQGFDWFNTHAIGTGPFKWVDDEWERGISWLVERNEDFWEPGIPFLDSKKTFLISDVAAQIAAFETKKIDYLGSASTTQNEQLLKKYGDQLRLLEMPGFGPTFAFLNTRKAPFDNPLVREAVYLWLDRQQFLDKAVSGKGFVSEWVRPELFGGLGTPLTELVEKNLAFKLDKTAARARAKELLEEAGYADLSGFKTRIIPQSPTGTSLRYAQVLEAQLKDMGFDTEITSMERLAAVVAFNAGDYEAAVYGTAISIPHPLGFFACCMNEGAPRNFTGLKDPVLQGLGDELAVAPDAKVTAEVVARIDEYLQKGTAGRYLLVWSKTAVLEWDYVRGRKYMNFQSNERDDRVWLYPNAAGRK